MRLQPTPKPAPAPSIVRELLPGSDPTSRMLQAWLLAPLESEKKKQEVRRGGVR